MGTSTPFFVTFLLCFFDFRSMLAVSFWSPESFSVFVLLEKVAELLFIDVEF